MRKLAKSKEKKGDESQAKPADEILLHPTERGLAQVADFTKFPVKKRRFLERFAECGTITHAARYACISRPTVAKWRREPNGKFKEAFDEALEMACDSLEAEARRRAYQGTVKQVFHQGKPCGLTRDYSDTLLIFLLKGAKPDKYKDRAVIDHGNKDEKPFVIETVATADPDDWSKTVDQEMKMQRAIADQASGEQ